MQSEQCLVKKLELLDVQFQTVLYDTLQLGEGPALSIQDLGKNFPQQFCRNAYIEQVGKSHAAEYPETGSDEFMIYHTTHLVSGTQKYTGICEAYDGEIVEGVSPEIDYESNFGQCPPSLVIGGIKADKVKVCDAKKQDPLDLRAQYVIYSHILKADGRIIKWADLTPTEQSKLCEDPLK